MTDESTTDDSGTRGPDPSGAPAVRRIGEEGLPEHRTDIPDPDGAVRDEDLPETQGTDPLLAERGADGEGDLTDADLNDLEEERGDL